MSHEGYALIVKLNPKEPTAAQTILVEFEPGTSLPRLPRGGIRTKSDLAGLHVVQDMEGAVYPSNRLSLYAVVRTTIERNIYRVRLP